jgi:NAD(P)-dependent dehydrogenase (short-subunit alcohol dehydrogenase family)
VLILHGGPGLSDYTAPLAAELTDAFTVISYQQRGLAPSVTSGPFTVSQHVADADLTHPQQVERASEAIEGPVDALVNTAGGIASRGMPEDRLANVARAWEADYQANVLSAVLLTRALAPRLRRPGGRVINVSSIARCAAAAVPIRPPKRAAGVDLRPGR